MKQYFFAIALLSGIYPYSASYADGVTLYDLADVELQDNNGRQEAYLKDGKALSGALIIEDDKGRKITYFYRDGLRDGVAVSRYGDGKMELEITYTHGMKNGEEISFYTNGNPEHKKTYRNNVLNGEEVLFYENGKPKQKNVYKEGVLDGETVYYTDEGGIIRVENYKNGLKHGLERIVENNVLKEEYNYENGVLSGIAKLYNGEYLTDEIMYKNGLKNGKHTIYQTNGYRVEIPYVDGKRNGEGVLYTPDKKIVEKVLYRNDMKNGMKRKYAADGTLLSAEYYKNDKKDGISRYFNNKGELEGVSFYVTGKELSRKNITNDKLINDIYSAFLAGHLNRYTKVKSHWYPILWLGLSDENTKILAELEAEMKMYGMSVNDEKVYEKESHDKYDEYNQELFLGLTPLSYLINIDAPVDFLNKFSASSTAIEEQNPRGTTALQEAVRLNNLEMVKYLLLKGANVNKVYNNGNTILLDAIKEHAINEITEELLKAGTDVNAKDNQGNTALLIVVKDNNKDLTSLLIKYNTDEQVLSSLGENILHYIYDKSQDKELFDIFFDKNKDVNVKDKNGDLLILKALKKNDTDMVKKLLAAGADVDLADENGVTAVSYVLSNKVSSEVEYEVLAKTSNLTNNIAIFDKPLWRIALDEKRPDILKMFIEKYDAASDDEYGLLYTILLKNEDEEITDIILTKIPQVDNNIVWKVLRSGNMDLLKKLAEKGFDANTPDEQGNTMLIYIVKHGFGTEYADILNEQGMSVDAEDINGVTAMDIAVHNNDLFWTKKLLELGADINKIIKGRLYLSEVRKDQQEMVKILLENGANTDFVTIDGETIFMSAVKNLNIPLIEYLLNLGGDISAKDDNGRTALFYLADSLDVYPQEGVNIIAALWLKIIHILEDNNMDINGRDVNGSTLLIEVAKNHPQYYDKIRAFMIDEGADVDIKDQYGKTADDYYYPYLRNK